MANSEIKAQTYGKLRNFFLRTKIFNYPKNKVNCNCCVNSQEIKKEQVVQTDTYVNCKAEEKLPILNVNTYGDPKKIRQSNGECPGKMFPSERRGCGFHMYFCIDNGEPNLARNNKFIRGKNEKNKLESCLEGREVAAISCKSESLADSGSLADSMKYLCHHESPPGSSPMYHKTKRHSSISRGKDISLHENNISAPASVHEITVKISKESGLSKQNENSPKNQEEKMAGKGSSILRSWKLSPTTAVNKVKVEAADIFIPSPQQIRQLYHTEIDPPRKHIESNTDEEAVFREYAILQQQKRLRKSTVKARSSRRTMGECSRLSLRQKRQSLASNMVPEIFSKLDNIEEKLSELEKVYEDNSKNQNVTNIVGIAYNSVQSTELENIGVKDELNRETFNRSAIDSYHIQPVLITSFGEDVIVNAPESVTVVKKRSKTGGACKKLVHHNTQELDAHNIASKSFNRTKATSHGPKHLFCNTKPNEITRKQDSNIWRRISEELKS